MRSSLRNALSIAAVLAGAGFAVLSPSDSRASSVAVDNSATAPYGDGWQNGDNGGSGFQPWILVGPGQPTFTGFFIGNSANNGSGSSGNINDPNGNAWGMYSNTNNLVDAVRPFTGDLSVGQTFIVDMDNGFIDPGSSQGFGLQNSSLLNRFEFYFAGGSGTYKVNDSISSSRDTGVGFTDGGLHLELTLTGTDTYSLNITPNGSGTTNITGTLTGAGGSGIDRFRGFGFNSGGGGGSKDLFFNKIAIPEPSSALLFGAGAFLLGLRRRSAK